MIQFCLDLNKNDTNEMIIDVLRALTQAVVVHVLVVTIDGGNELFSEKILKKFLYISLSMFLFNLIVKKLIPLNDKKIIKKTKNNEKIFYIL